MRKPQQLREAIETWNSDFKENPDKLRIYVRNGTVAARSGGGMGFQYSYRLEIDIQGFTGSTNTLIFPIVQWLHTHQPDLTQSPSGSERAIAIEVDVLDAETADINLAVNLTEAITSAWQEADPANGIEEGYKIDYRDEVSPIDGPMSDPQSLLRSIFDRVGQVAPPVVE